MFWLVLLLLAIIIIAILAAKTKPADGDASWPFYAKKPLTNPEQILYFRLKQALPDQIILAQVQLSRFLGVKKGHNFQSWLNRINRMSADFVVCNKDASIVAVIELDDGSHQSDKRREADEKKDRALKSAGIHFYRWHVKTMPNEEGIKAALLEMPIALQQVNP